MKYTMISLLILLFCLMGVPAVADTVYDNGPINGTTDAWQINFGFVTSDTFTVGANGSTLTGLSFGAWTFGGYFVDIEVSITSDEFGGTTYFDQRLNVTQSNCVPNQFGIFVCIESVSFAPVTLAGGTYWLNLQNGDIPDEPVYWDENSGPSQASQNSVGTVPSEAFTLLGTNGSTTTTSTSGTVPEPGSFMLFGSGMLALASILRGKLP